jgi:hypothetical protein
VEVPFVARVLEPEDAGTAGDPWEIIWLLTTSANPRNTDVNMLADKEIMVCKVSMK